MKFKKRVLASLLFAIVSSVSSLSFAISGNGTPTQYTVNLQSVAFHPTGSASSNYVTYRSGSSNVNLATVAAGQPCAELNPTSNLQTGNYDQMRIVVSKTMIVKGASNGNLGNGLPCRTVNGGALVTDPYGDGSIAAAYLGATDGGTPEAETVIVPSGTAVDLPSSLSATASTLQATIPINIVVRNQVPQATVKFDVTNSVLFMPLGLTQCIVFPVPPTINVTAS